MKYYIIAGEASGDLHTSNLMKEINLLDKKAKFRAVKEVKAAMGVRIVAPNLDDAIAGMPLASLRSDSSDQEIEQVKQEYKQRLKI